MKRTLFLFLVCNISGWAAAQTKSPEEFLGYKLGERFTPHHKIVAYFEHVAEENSNVQLQFYGETYEKRPLLLAFISSEKNIGNLESIRLDNLRRAGMLPGSPQTKVPVTWLSYNVHGNEAVSSEAALKTLWALVDPAETDTKTWLE
ncbi:MAG TPA: M14 family zinc carboxypeptidase, partial [Cyclobacteriaceae bacterium]|nr:M14 family zinc carboxypeptidase [Cyclobacteriaceae bacterium]